MYCLVLFSALLACAAGVPPNNAKPRLDGRIVGGTETDITSHPHQVAVLRTTLYLCSGSIISGKWVVTVARYVLGYGPTDLNVRTGSTYSNSGGILHSVTNIIIHENYISASGDYNVALLQVNPGFTFNNNVRPITLQCKTVPGGTYGVLTGWGYSPEIDDYSTTLRQVTLQITSDSECNSKYANHGGITYSMICAGDILGGTGACLGEYGAPLVAGDKLVGIFNWGLGCGDPQYPDVFTKISRVCDWIETYACV